jgi:glycerol-3-phosphate dehydrogenase
MTSSDPVLVLGAGVNGAAAARELALNGCSVLVVDTADIAFGATAYSSRLIHGGLRYLEYGEFDLVRESLAERTRLLRLAPRQVRPLRLFIPVKNRWGGLVNSATRFLGLPSGKPPREGRGQYLVEAGLWFYDRYARDRTLPARSMHRLDDPVAPRLRPEAGRLLCAYSDAQATFPERLTVELLLDAQAAARERGVDFQVRTYHQATLHDKAVELRPTGAADGSEGALVRPAAIVNATGAWVDQTLARLPVSSRRLMGGTKGSHFFTWHAGLAEALQGSGLYAEAPDGRPVFVLPLASGTLVGTTDIPFSGNPADAVASEQELDYLLEVVNGLVRDVRLTREDIGFHYCGVRPLPFVDARTPAAITRRHALVWNEASPIPLVSLVGGKLTTARSLAEETATAVLTRIGRKVQADSRERPIPAGESPSGSRTHLGSAARQAIAKEWATRLEDLIERRLMLLYDQQFSAADLQTLADELVTANKLASEQRESAIAAAKARLQQHFGRTLR